MFKHFFQQLFTPSRTKNRDELVLVGTCFVASEAEKLWFDEAEQAIEYAYYWFMNTDSANCLPIRNGGYFPVSSQSIVDVMDFTHRTQSLIEQNKTPILISNSCESLTECVAEYSQGTLGIVNINHRLDLVSSMSFVPMEGYASVLSENTDVGMLSVGVYEEMHSATDLTLAKSMGVSWITSSMCYAIEPRKVYEKLELFLNTYDAIAINIDLASLVSGMTVKPPFALHIGLISELVLRCMQSKKVKIIQLTGDSEARVFSKETKKIMDTIRTKITHKTYAN